MEQTPPIHIYLSNISKHNATQTGTALSLTAFGVYADRFADNTQPLLTKAFLVLLKRILGYSNKIGYDRIVTHNVSVYRTKFVISSYLKHSMYFTMSHQIHMNQAHVISYDMMSFRILQHYTNVVQTSNVESDIIRCCKGSPAVSPN